MSAKDCTNPIQSRIEWRGNKTFMCADHLGVFKWRLRHKGIRFSVFEATEPEKAGNQCQIDLTTLKGGKHG